MKDSTKKVVILENLSSPYVSQAIIVMRDYDPRLESRAIIEAERIVTAYLDNTKLNSGRPKKIIRKKVPFILYLAAAIAIAAAAVVIIRL